MIGILKYLTVRQLAESQDHMVMSCEDFAESRSRAYQRGGVDAIDEFVALINTMPIYENADGEKMPMPIEMMAEQLKEKKEMNWYTNTVPECKKGTISDEVLVSVLSPYGRKRVLKAVYVGDHTTTTEDMGWNTEYIADEWVYDETSDGYWIPQGWYETADNFEDYDYAPINGKVYAWAKLPRPYEPKVKDIAGISRMLKEQKNYE